MLQRARNDERIGHPLIVMAGTRLAMTIVSTRGASQPIEGMTASGVWEGTAPSTAFSRAT